MATSYTVRDQRPECPIDYDVQRPGVNLFTMAKLNHGYAAYIGMSERKAMTERIVAALYAQPDYSVFPMLMYHLRQLQIRSDYSIDYALEKLGWTAQMACPWMERVLFDLNLALLYVKCDEVTGEPVGDEYDSVIRYAYEVRALDVKEQSKWRPARWQVIDLKSVSPLTRGSIARELANRQEAKLAHSAQVKEHKRKMRHRLSQELKDLSTLTEVAENDDATPMPLEEKLRLQTEQEEIERVARFTPSIERVLEFAKNECELFTNDKGQERQRVIF